MDFCLIVKITKKDLSIHYKIANGEVEVLMNDGSAEIPMAFCLNGGELLMNRFASEQARLGSGNAFCDYFDLIKDPYRTFRFAGEDKPIRQLLYYGLEAMFASFLREKVYDPNPIESHRETFPLRFLFADDISKEERQFVVDLFLEQGYKNVAEAQITEQIFGVLLPNYSGSILTLSGIDGDLFVNYYSNAHTRALHSKRMPSLGKDQRLNACIDLMLDYINERYYNPFTTKEDVEDILLKEAIQQCSNDGGPMIVGSIIGPDGETYDYEVLRKNIERKLQALQGSSSLVTEVKYFLRNIGVDSQNLALVLLEDVNSDYFKEMLNGSFVTVVGSSEYHQKRIWEEVFQFADFSVPSSSKPKPIDVAPPPVPPEPKTSRPPVTPLMSGRIDVTPPSKPPKPSAPPLPPTPPNKPSAPPPPPPSPTQRGVAPPPPPPAPKKKTAVPPPPPPSPRKTAAPPPPPPKKK